MENNRYSVLIYTENTIGLLSQISNIFTRRTLSIWSMLALPTDIKGIHTIMVVTDGDVKKVQQAVLHCEKIVDVIKVFYFEGNRMENRDLKLYSSTEAQVKDYMEQRAKEKELFY